MPRPLSPAFLTTFALARVDDAATIEGPASDMAAPARRYRVSDDAIGQEWSAAFVHHVGYWSHFDYRVGTSVWPLPASSNCEELATFAERHLVLTTDPPQIGDIYLLWSPARKRFVRAGIVLACTQPLGFPSGRTGYECLTIDGDTTGTGSLRGPCTAIVRRVLSPGAGDRLIRWPEIDLYSYERPIFAESAVQRAA